jgi:type VI secretion system protein VasI
MHMFAIARAAKWRSSLDQFPEIMMRANTRLATIAATVAGLFATADLEAQSTCKGIADNLRRLACYDSANATTAIPVASKPAASSSSTDTGEWELSEKRDPITDAIRVSAALKANDNESRNVRNATMFVRCDNKELDLFVSWGKYLSDNRGVTLRIDDAPPVTKSWSTATGKTALFAPGDVRAFASQLASAKRFVAQANPYDEAPATAVFDLAGAEKAIAKVLAACPAK